MKRTAMITAAVLVAFAGVLGIAVASPTGSAQVALEAGDHVYACNCGEKCPCGMISRHAGSCTCGEDMVEAEVVSVGDGTASLKAEGWEKPREFKTTGAYHCACGPDCTCDTVSQKPGTCPCGSEMAKTHAS